MGRRQKEGRLQEEEAVQQAEGEVAGGRREVEEGDPGGRRKGRKSQAESLAFTTASGTSKGASVSTFELWKFVFGCGVDNAASRHTSMHQPRRPNVQQPLHAENGAENQPIGAENQPQEVAIDAPQKCVALSTTEAEYVGATEASKEALWLMRLVEELGIKSQVPVLHSDSQNAIMLARNPVFHAKTKYIEVKYHFLSSVLDDKNITLVKVHTNDNPADLLTKSLPAERFAYCRQMMGIG
ncbi:hypothetical protein L7F22_051957 [Adiantum nelumboides]|nr:hypothetical protein [Adiantum nelumboides]